MAIHVRERPPLRHHIDAESLSGRSYRWGLDEPDPENVFSGLKHSSTMPGGFEALDCVLPRKPGVDYEDLEGLSTIRVRDSGGGIVSETRLERTPRVSGERMALSPSAVGWQAHLDDDQSAHEIYLDRETASWRTPPRSRQVSLATAGSPQGKIPVEVGSGIVWNLPNEAVPAGELTEVHYDAGSGLKVGEFGYDGQRTGAFTNFEAPTVFRSDSEDFSSSESSGLTLDDTVRSVVFSTARRYLMLRVRATAAQTPGAGWQQLFDQVGVYGTHGLPKRAIAGQPGGFFASDIVAHAVRTWAPELRFTEGVDGTVQPSSFVIPHLAFRERTTAGNIIRQVTRFGLQDWAVWEYLTFWWHERGTRGRRWRARVAPAQLEETGPDIKRVWESVIVEYRDVDGSTRTVGPPGSGADTETPDLKDEDPENLANKHNIIRRDLLRMRTGTAGSATEVGRRFLDESKLIDNSGRARLVGHVEDNRGGIHPYSRVRAGDQISFIDAADTSYRRIVRADHIHEERTCQVDLDAPPEGLEQLLERLDVVLVPLGIS